MENRKDVLLDIRNLEVEYKTEEGVVEAVNKQQKGARSDCTLHRS